KEFATTGGAAAQTINLPSTGSAAFTEKGTNTAEGYVTNALDGHSASLIGYNVTAGTSTSFTNSPIGVINPNGSIESSTLLPSGDSGGAGAAVASADGTGLLGPRSNLTPLNPLRHHPLPPT